MRQILIVANQTVGSDALAGEVRARMAAGECRFLLLVPASEPTGFQSAAVSMEAIGVGMQARPGMDAFEVARSRMRGGVAWLDHLGATAEGEVGDENPLRAIRASLRGEGREFDEIIVSTLPTRVSRWLRMDLPRRVKREFGLPVTVVTAGR
jgi:hypothetical protein